MLPEIALGKSSLRSTRLAYGCWRIAPHADDSANLALAKEAVFAAFDCGIRSFDHADIYCGGMAEEVFGRLLKGSPGLRGEMMIATKCGIRFKDHPPGSPARYDFSGDHIVRQCELSLKRLGVETIDLYYLHRPDYLMNAEEVAAAFSSLRESGKVREFGVSNFKASQFSLLQSALDFPLVAHQLEVSLLQLGALHGGDLDYCQEHRITPFAWSPLGAGVLGSGGKDLLPGQRGYSGDEVLPVLDAIALRLGVAREALALAWLLRHPSKMIPVIGSTRPQRIRSMANAAQIELEREDWYHLVIAARGEPLP